MLWRGREYPERHIGYHHDYNISQRQWHDLQDFLLFRGLAMETHHSGTHQLDFLHQLVFLQCIDKSSEKIPLQQIYLL
jgi:hypothetical protein